jgi:hypothetical protein
MFADTILKSHPDIRSLIATINRFSSKKLFLRKALEQPISGSLIGECLHLIHGELSQYTMKTGEHLKGLSFTRLWDRRLGTTREQYHLYMLEIELSNRLFALEFKKAGKKIALLPYCLRDFSVTCKAEKKGFDYQCRHCSGKCFENHTSLILKKNNIEPYIWRGANIKQMAVVTRKKGQQFAVFGIACIPELVWGIRKCRKYNIPVLGLPLNANRCIRWFGSFYPNSVDLDELVKLVSERVVPERGLKDG